ncbi:DUF1273 domain-containing protein [Lactococcus taiwanensis]|jgi:uncharacterized phage-like protein YoqJ|uniref:UPF0398 protein JW886_03205 n=1 Tax=Lactococcus taiwanensis TaxID=1151742 RepID=A0AA45KH57_9LACT|nr:DUF1273 domain-containing protein [Lactococcus taiwanensis]QRZ10352.1 DUF1273 domain-containing protein [Lactococcus taiwanensis]QSE77282.1 DUF1273 domain-containing protein [Lactococcus taiwanensis]
MNSLLIMGYTSFDLGIFNEKDIKVSIIKKAVKNRLIRYLEEGLNWLIFTGNLGFEYWALDVAKELQKDYNFQIGTIFSFETHGQNWNENNQVKLAHFKEVDFVKYAYQTYENPSQFRQYNDFLLENTEGALVFYDEENETKLKYMVERMKQMAEYQLEILDFETLQETFEDMNE